MFALKLKSGFVLKSVGDNHIVVPVGAQTVDFRCMITLNDTGAFLWKLLETEQTEETLVTALLEEYDVTAERASADVAAFLANLQDSNLLEE